MKKILFVSVLLFFTEGLLAEQHFTPTIESLNTGYVSPLMESRTDFGKYKSSCRTLENMFVTPQGPATRRPGTKYIATVKDDSNAVDEENETYDGVATTTTDVLHYLGKVGTGSFDLDGQYAVEIDDNDVFTFSETGNPFSIVAWAHVTDSAEVQTIISKWEEGTGREWRLQLLSDETLRLELYDDSLGLDVNCISQWKLNEDANSNAVDDAQEEQDGVATANTEDLHVAGKLDGAFDFDEQYAVVIDDNDVYSFGDGTDDSPFSIAAWIYNDGSNGYQIIVSKNGSATTSYDEWYFALVNQKLYLILYDKNANAYRFKITDSTISTGWHLVVATYDGSGGTSAADKITLYVDDVDTASTTGSVGTYVAMENLDGLVRIGAGFYSSGVLAYYFRDKIDNVMIFDKELSASEVLSLYASGSGTEDLAGDSIYTTTDDALETGWHLIIATYDSTGGVSAANGIALYVDNNTAADTTVHNYANYVAMENTATDLRIGSQLSSESAQQYIWQDKLDNIIIFDYELTSSDIAILRTEGPYKIETPYSQSESSDIQYAQSGSNLYLVHPNHPPQKLERYTHDWWIIDDVDITTGPFLSENTTSTTITPSDVNGTITLTASSPIFRTSHIGSIWEINQKRDTSVFTGTLDADESSSETDYFYGGYSFTTDEESVWDATVTLERSTNNGTTWQAALSSLHKTNFDNPAETEETGAIYRATMEDFVSGSCDYTFVISDPWNHGIIKITGYSNPTTVTADVIVKLANTDAASRWREGYWSDYRGWPQTVEFHQQRLVFGGSASYPQHLWFGRANPSDYENFTEGTLDTSSFTMALEGQNPIRWLLSQDYLFIGTMASVGKYGGQGEAITPTSPSYREQSKSGSASIRSVLAGDAILYVERGGQRVREFIYNLSMDKFISPPLTILAEDIANSGIKDIAFQTRPDSILWCVLNDGDIAALTYQREQEIFGWSLQTTDGDFESIAKIPTESGEDEIWVEVERTIDNSSVRYIEQFQPRDWSSDINDCWFVDCALNYDGNDANSFTGLNHLINKDVYVLGDGVIEPNEIVDANGEIVIDRAAGRITAGLPFTSKLETMPIYLDPMDKPYSKNILQLWFDFYKTGFCKYAASKNASKLTNINFENDMRTDPNATAQELYTSDNMLKEVIDQYSSSQKHSIYLESDAPLPLTVRSITYNVVGYSK